MTEGLACGPEDEKPIATYRPGWVVLDPDGNVVAVGPQSGAEASADAGEET
jgi:hypothetical protein